MNSLACKKGLNFDFAGVFIAISSSQDQVSHEAPGFHRAKASALETLKAGLIVGLNFFHTS